jgi:hypothetical protein
MSQAWAPDPRPPQMNMTMQIRTTQTAVAPNPDACAGACWRRPADPGDDYSGAQMELKLDSRPAPV